MFSCAASLNAGKDKQVGDAFFIPAVAREQVESLYRGDWLALKIVDIVPYDCVSPAGLSATGDHDTRNYYDMIAARQ